MSNYYKMMGIEITATAEEIKIAWRRLAKKYHPDVNKSKYSKEKFQRINEAYRILSNPLQRKTYDSNLNRQQSKGRRSNTQEQYEEATRGERRRNEDSSSRYGIKAKGTWTKIRSGEFDGQWGVWVKSSFNIEVGDPVIVVAKSGRVSLVFVAAIVVKVTDYTLCAVYVSGRRW